MLNLYLRHGLFVGCCLFLLLTTLYAHSAVTLDRTRIVFPGNERAINIRITNDNPEEAYLAQSWIEDLQGNKLTKGAILATPPLQRIEPNSDSLVRLSVTPLLEQLPQDRESVFYFNLREVPPKSTEGNTLQIALQSRVKLFYRPKNILSESQTQWAHKITLARMAKGYQLKNHTPFHLTVIGLGNSKSQSEQSRFDVVMVPPKSTHDIISPSLSTPYLTYINDYGGKPTLAFRCIDAICTVREEL
ncbi:fimbrial biogenesis chaperone [Providencia stuartii]|uniref:fimbrial biogenesis chaperone n=1 Tax=Providencia stuartii TaxID=588 RepID=UPI00332A66C2